MNKSLEKYAEHTDGGIYWVKIELIEEERGVLFVSPVDGQEHLVRGVTLTDLKGAWWNSHSRWVEILEAIADMGGGRWVLGDSTNYDYHEEKGNHYLEVTEIGRQEEGNE